MPSKINELGQTENEKGNILCRKTGTRKDGMPWEKTQHLSKLVVNNSAWMQINGWEVVIQPEAPPVVKGKNEFSARSYDQEKNQREATATNDAKFNYGNVAEMAETVNPELKKYFKETNTPEIKSEVLSGSQNPIESNKPFVGVLSFESNNTNGNPGTNKPPPKKRGRKPGTKIVKKVTQDKKQKVNA